MKFKDIPNLKQEIKNRTVYVLTPNWDKTCWSGVSVNLDKKELLKKYGECNADLISYDEDDGSDEEGSIIRRVEKIYIYWEGERN